MRIVKKIGIGLLVIIGLLLIVALFVSNDFHYEKSITINKPIEEVWENTKSLKAIDTWSPWMEYDPNMKKELSGTDGTIGAKVTWESDHEKVGKGSQTITKIDKPNLFATDLKFYTPYESEAKGFIELKPEGNNTIVTWGFDSEMPYPFNLMQLFMDIEEAIGEDFDLGLTKLKQLSENQ
ncbi:SRPBCC family protein [Sediminicola luteus]|uniref:SRPBCC family protein n=1 Tax=Sediminicola luteus TaxID=319238 RepID=A0ABV2TXA5_9FLAO